METIHTLIARKALSEYFEKKSTKEIENKPAPEGFQQRQACFVTLKTPDHALRGCIGTIEPIYQNLYIEIIKNAISSAFRDYRFSPLTKNEFKTIQISVEVLSPIEPIAGPEQLNPKKYGAIIIDSSGRRGVLLPDIEGIETVSEQIRIIKRKAGITQEYNENLTFYRFTTDKYK